ncbi:MAG TPA: crossover junction endodeoxyribonuclease RuvC [Patescibacteria group bacterium]
MSKLSSTVILGIDPGYDRVGWAVGEVRGQTWLTIHHGCLKTSKAQTLFERYRQIAQELSAIIKTHQPTILAIESLFFFKNQKTALKVSEARGVIINTCLNHDLDIAEFTPLQIKQAVTGYGRADKNSVEKMLRLELKLTEHKIIDDTIDALAVMMTYQAQSKFLRAKVVA